MRRVRLIVACALIGTAINILVAWAFVLLGGFRGGALHVRYADGRPLDAPIVVPKGWDVATWRELHGLGLRMDMVSEREWVGSSLILSLNGGPQRTVTHYRAGFPFLALRWLGEGSDVPEQNTTGIARAWWMGIDAGLPVRAGGVPRSGIVPRLPIRPAWPGFALDTLLFGAAAGGVMLAAGAARSGRRRRRGLCVACGYDVVGLAVCPECGTASPLRSADAARRATLRKSAQPQA